MMMRFAVLCVAAASLLRGREQLEAQVARSAVKLLQEAMAPEPEKTASKATPAKEEPKATPAKEEPKATPAKEEAKATPAKEEAKATPAKAESKATPVKAEAKATPAKAEAKVPKKKDPAQQKMVIDQLMKLAANLQSNEKKIVEMDKEEVSSQKDHEKLKANMSDADKKMWDHFDDWNHRMNQKTKVGSLDVISKIKHAE